MQLRNKDAALHLPIIRHSCIAEKRRGCYGAANRICQLSDFCVRHSVTLDDDIMFLIMSTSFLLLTCILTLFYFVCIFNIACVL